MKVSRERLQIIGRMIGILREEKRQNKQNCWTQVRFCQNICTPNTLKSIESGKVGLLDNIYEQLLAKLGLRYDEFPMIDEAIEKIVTELHEAIEYYDLEKIKDLTLLAMKVLKNVKGYVYYSELYALFFHLQHYYEDDIYLDEAMSEHYISLLELFPSSVKDIVSILVFASIKGKCVSNVNVYRRYVKTLDMEHSHLMCLKVNLMHYYYKIDERMKAIELIKCLENEFKTKNNPIRLLDTYNGAINLMGYIDKKLIDEYIERTMKLLETRLIPVNKKSETYTNIADSYHREKNYEKALKCFYESVSEGCEVLVFNYILIADCQNHLGIPIDIAELNKDDIKKFPKELRTMYNYFLSYKDEEVPPPLKQKLLMKRIVPLLQDDVLIDVFEYELKKLVKLTNSYKDLSIFDEIVKQNINSL